MAKLTEKMSAFAEEYVKNGYNGAGAYAKAYDQDNKQVCASEAYKMLRDPRILEQIESVEGSFRVLGQMAGIDKKSSTKVLVDMLFATKTDSKGEEVPDHAARKDAITLFGKFTGDFKERKELEITNKDSSDIDPTKMTAEERSKLEQELLDEL